MLGDDQRIKVMVMQSSGSVITFRRHLSYGNVIMREKSVISINWRRSWRYKCLNINGMKIKRALNPFIIPSERNTGMAGAPENAPTNKVAYFDAGNHQEHEKRNRNGESVRHRSKESESPAQIAGAGGQKHYNGGDPSAAEMENHQCHHQPEGWNK